MTERPFEAQARTFTSPVNLTAAERDALTVALDDYLENRLIVCDNAHDHGDETDCDGWGPQGVAELVHGARMIRR